MCFSSTKATFQVLFFVFVKTLRGICSRFIDYIAVTIAQYRYMILRTMTHVEQISPILISTESTRVVEIYEPIEIDDRKLNRIVKNYYPKSSGAHQRSRFTYYEMFHVQTDFSLEFSSTITR